MKSLEYSLNYILKELEKNWDGKPEERQSMVCETILRKFGLPDNYRKHEFFIRLIDRLIKDGYAEIIDRYDMIRYSPIQEYQDKTIITIEGYYFIKNGGYINQKNMRTFKVFAQILNVSVLCVAACVAAVYYYKEMRKSPQQPEAHSKDTVLLKVHVLQHQDSTFLINIPTLKKIK